MFSEIAKIIVLAAIAIITTIVGILENLLDKPIVIDVKTQDAEKLTEAKKLKETKKTKEAKKTNSAIRRKKIAAIIAIIGVLVTQAFQVRDKQKDLEKLDEKKREQRDSKMFLDSGLYEIDEASGGTILGDFAYIVDDDNPLIFPMKYGKNGEKPNEYDFEFPVHGIPICDARTDGSNIAEKSKESCEDGSRLVDDDILEDLEGVASYGKYLYLVTSHSDSPKRGKDQPERKLFLEIELEKDNNGNVIAGKILHHTRILRDKIKEQFKDGIQKLKFEDFEQKGRDQLSKKKITEVINIEGLAIDSKGQIYFGFRNPPVGKYALVLQTDINQVFGADPKFNSFLLPLGGYGIVSLDFKDEKIYILGNSPDRYDSLDIKIWEWEPNTSSPVQELKKPYQGENLFTKFSDGIGARPAKPEVLLIPNDKTFHLFFDADGTGGQLSLFRKDNVLSREAIY